jgi:RNA polymerase sigma-70 factor, ECF subfamily
LLRAGHTLIGDRIEAEDMVQEVFVNLVRSRARLPYVQHLSAYLFTALRRVAQRKIEQRERDERHRRNWFAQTILKHPSASDDMPQLADALRRAVARLPLAQREVLALKLDGGFSFREIGEQLAISTNTAASRYRYAIEHLRTELGEQHE